MASLLGFSAFLVPPTPNEALSGIFGSVSLTAWICLLLPQLLANYKAQRADALSMGFLFIWLAGDVANLSGALFTNLAPTAIALACYFCLADVILITQCSYYNAKNARSPPTHRGRRRTSREEPPAAADPGPSEHSPLLARRRSSSAGGLPGSFRSGDTHEPSGLEPLRKAVAGEDQTRDARPWLNNTLALLAVWLVGGLGWFVSYKFGAWDTDSSAGGPVVAPGEVPPTHQIGSVLGYISAVLYLCARIPQIIKNYRDQSCEGLALLFFLLSITGNLAYGFSLVAYSQEPRYLLTALPWLLGSLGTVVEDSIIFVQFRIYSGNSASEVAPSS